MLTLRYALLLALALTRSEGRAQAASKPESGISSLFSSSSVGDLKTFESTVAFLRERNAREYAIKLPQGIDESIYVPIGGTEEWITIRGYDRRNPVLIFLHGGPGDVTNPWSFPYFDAWEKHFTVVQWDQRGAGRSLAKSGPSIANTMSLDRMVEDGIEVSQFVTKHLGKPKAVLVGHSFGTLLGLKMIQKRPELFSAYVGTGQVATETDYLQVDYDALLAKARRVGNTEAQAELVRIGRPPFKLGSEGFVALHRWSNFFEGADAFLEGQMGLALVSPAGNSLAVLNAWGAGQDLSAERLWPQMKTITQRELGYEFNVPIFFFQGAEDFNTPTSLARGYLDAIHAPKKAFVPLSGGHFAVFMHSQQFLEELVKEVLPIAQQAGLADH